MLDRGFAYLKNGQPVPDGVEVRFYSHETKGLLATTTIAGGEFVYNFQGNPGPYWTELEYGGEVQIRSSKVVGMSGPTSVAGIPLLFNVFDDGYIPGLLDQLAVTSSGVGMSVSVGGGAAIVAGVLYDQSAPWPVTISPAEAQPRIDTVVLEVVPAGADDDTEGRARVVLKKGTAAATPVAPSLTQTPTLWEMPLADIRVDTGVSSIAANKVTDRRARAHTKIGNRYITTTMIALGAIQDGNLDTKTIGGDKLKDATVTEDKLSADVATKLNASSRMISKEIPFSAYGERASVNYAEVASGFITLTPGTWKVKTSASFDVIGTGAVGTVAGTFAVRIMNESSEVHRRNYRSSPGIYRPVYISKI